MHRDTRAFTLVELLVVVGIIGMILSMIVPSLVNVTDLARETTCKNNLQLLSKATFAYFQANNDLLPKNDTENAKYWMPPDEDKDQYLLPGVDSTFKWWCNKVYRYGVTRPGIYICPTDPGRAGDTEPVKCGYGFNNTLTNPSSGGSGASGAAGDGAKSIFEITDSERTAMIGHCSSLTRDPAILEDMALDTVNWPIGHMKTFDRTAKEKLGRVGFIMASGQVLVKTYTEVMKIKNANGKLVLFHTK